MKKKTERPLCLVCGKPISTKNCGFEKEVKIEFDTPKEMEKELEQRLRDKGWVL